MGVGMPMSELTIPTVGLGRVLVIGISRVSEYQISITQVSSRVSSTQNRPSTCSCLSWLVATRDGKLILVQRFSCPSFVGMLYYLSPCLDELTKTWWHSTILAVFCRETCKSLIVQAVPLRWVKSCKCQLTHIKWGLILKLSMSLFTWHSPKSLRIFFHFESLSRPVKGSQSSLAVFGHEFDQYVSLMSWKNLKQPSAKS